MNPIRQIYFRSSLRSCNYHCSYCSFGKKEVISDEEKDRRSLQGFYESVTSLEGPLKIMLIPYGEGLIHAYYQEFMIRLAALPNVEAVSCQTNLSFVPEAFMEQIEKHKVDKSKIKLWASYHPEMVEVDAFIDNVHYLFCSGIDLCAGVVGSKGNTWDIYGLRQKLDKRIYLFINAMQGKSEPLDSDDVLFFTSIDPLFPIDYKNMKADIDRCRGGRDTVFIDAEGNVYPCPRNPFPDCRKERCDCYIAYSNLTDTPLARMMGEGTFFRIPERHEIEAVFFDVDGTLTDADGDVLDNYQAALRLLADKIPLYLATSLPLLSAKRKLGDLFALFSGGVFADGGHLLYNEQDEYVPLTPIPDIDDEECYVKAYQEEGILYKYVIRASTTGKAKEIRNQLGEETYNIQEKGFFLTIVDAKAGKKNGVEAICSKMNYNVKNAAAIGNTMNDWPMLSAVGYPCAVIDADPTLRQLTHYVLNPDHLAFIITS